MESILAARIDAVRTIYDIPRGAELAIYLNISAIRLIVPTDPREIIRSVIALLYGKGL
jgi:hypothetical protein